jgi:uncharacterized protein YjbI with pentapeptide repeats
MEDYIQDKTFDKLDINAQALVKGDYENCVFTACDLSNADLSGFSFSACTFRDCNLGMVKLNNTAFREVQFIGCKMLGIQFGKCNPFGLSFCFEHCRLDHSSFYQARLKDTRFVGSQLYETDFTDCDLTAAVFDNCDLLGATFENTILEKADLSTAYNYIIDPELNRIKKAAFSLAGIPGLLVRYDIEIR